MAHSTCTRTRHATQTGTTSGSRPLHRRAWWCLFFWIAMLAPHHFLSNANQLATVSAQETRQTAQRSYDLRIEKRTLAGGAKLLRAVQGEQVALRWISDEPTTLHLHGYDVELALVPGTPGTMTFQAYATGRFPITVHGHGHADKPAAHKEKTLVYLEVHPR